MRLVALARLVTYMMGKHTLVVLIYSFPVGQASHYLVVSLYLGVLSGQL